MHRSQLQRRSDFRGGGSRTATLTGVLRSGHRIIAVNFKRDRVGTVEDIDRLTVQS